MSNELPDYSSVETIADMIAWFEALDVGAAEFGEPVDNCQREPA